MSNNYILIDIDNRFQFKIKNFQGAFNDVQRFK